MSRKHYHVLVGMPGYMPESNTYCTTLTEARQCAKWEADIYRDDWGDDAPVYRVTGNMHDGYDVYQHDSGDLDVTITINECWEPECSESDNENS